MKKNVLLIALLLIASIAFYSCNKKPTSTQTQSTYCANTGAGRVFSQDTCICIIPNSFTPNSDGRNDIFRTICRNVSNYSLTIKDGTTVLFTTTNNNVGWDGMSNNALMPAGRYTLEISGNLNNGPSINTSMCISLCEYNTSSNCIPQTAGSNFHTFEDQIDPITGAAVFPTGEILCP